MIARIVSDSYPITSLWEDAAPDVSGLTLLHKAASEGQADVVKGLLAAGADVNARSKGSSTPLHFAALWGHAEIAKLLLDAGADVNARNNEDQTPLHRAVLNGRTDVATLLAPRRH